MTTLDDIIIRPNGKRLFSGRQGTFFWPKTYKYESSDGLKLRSKNECKWHSIFSREGIIHTYEPNIPGTKYRPDFGIANNFILEVCGMVDSPQHNDRDAVKKEQYRLDMDAKRKELLCLGYNLIELYPKEIVLNGYAVKNVGAANFVINIVRKYNSNYLCSPKIVSFKKIG
ncbi:MAG: hypothetical protein QXD13_02360 [Candidatus Pacearchaeota archaeon]